MSSIKFCECFCYHHHHYGINHTSQHLSAGKLSPVLDCRWDNAQSGEVTSFCPPRSTGMFWKFSYYMTHFVNRVLRRVFGPKRDEVTGMEKAA